MGVMDRQTLRYRLDKPMMTSITSNTDDFSSRRGAQLARRVRHSVLSRSGKGGAVRKLCVYFDGVWDFRSDFLGIDSSFGTAG